MVLLLAATARLLNKPVIKLRMPESEMLDFVLSDATLKPHSGTVLVIVESYCWTMGKSPFDWLYGASFPKLATNAFIWSSNDVYPSEVCVEFATALFQYKA